MLDAHSIRIMKRTSECRINERVWKRHNAYGRCSISCICWLPIDVFIDLNKGTVSYLRSFFHSSACTLCSLSLLFYYIRPSSILNSPRFHAYCYLPSFCLSRALSRFTLFSFTPLFWFRCAMCTTFSSIFNFPHTRSVDHNCLERGCTA